MLSNGPRRILIADNDEDVLIALEHVLESSGYTTVTTLNHGVASKLMGEEGFVLCVLDDYLSDKGSIDVLAECRRGGNEALVVLTFHRFPSPHEEKQFRSLGVSAFVNKRAYSELVDIVSQLLTMRSRPRSAFDDMT